MATNYRPIEVRFWEKIAPEPNSGCWLWVGAVNDRGYGQISNEAPSRKKIYAHRFSYELHKGPIQSGLDLDHLCRVRCCVNPDHLEPVTRLENVRRGDDGAKNRGKTHCPQGHPYSGHNLIIAK